MAQLGSGAKRHSHPLTGQVTIGSYNIMGKFDSFYVPCPKCGARVEFETQWNREMASLSLENAPSEILFDVMNNPHYCEACGQWMALVDPAYPRAQEVARICAQQKCRPPRILHIRGE